MEADYNFNSCKLMIVSQESDDDSSGPSEDEDESEESSSEDEPGIYNREFILFCSLDRTALNDFSLEVQKRFFKELAEVRDDDVPELPRNVVLPVELYDNINS